MPPVGFEPTVSAGERPHTHALDRAATGTGCYLTEHNLMFMAVDLLVPILLLRWNGRKLSRTWIHVCNNKINTLPRAIFREKRNFCTPAFYKHTQKLVIVSELLCNQSSRNCHQVGVRWKEMASVIHKRFCGTYCFQQQGGSWRRTRSLSPTH